MDYWDPSLDFWYSHTTHQYPRPPFHHRSYLHPASDRWSQRTPIREEFFGNGHFPALYRDPWDDELPTWATHECWGERYPQHLNAERHHDQEDRAHDRDYGLYDTSTLFSVSESMGEAERNNRSDPYLADNEKASSSSEVPSKDSRESRALGDGMCAPQSPEIFFAESLKTLREYLLDLKQEREKFRQERVELEKLRETFERIVETWCENRLGVWRIQQEPGRDNEPSRSPQKQHERRQTCERSLENTAFERYDNKWLEVQLAELGDMDAINIPWPTRTLKMDGLSEIPAELRTCFLHGRVNAPDDSLLRQWNAFTFFLAAFDLKPGDPQHYCGKGAMRTDDQCHLNFNIQVRGRYNLAKVQKLKAKLLEEKRRWHPDGQRRKWRLRQGSNEVEEECAKAVFNAVVNASTVCGRLLSRASDFRGS
ncbi:predicted protein [Uncinocarpus reesii 1704]|uniref:Uncharacterized protein n=1 Tax=Uncinocarpus reesii (strain UAMH 1704) TaxID=336963 RepID=C4JFG2_UNCRE|nr:uncharacterized protein UREG_00976 [Uncinocarpus reesii 1704]EEP76127.1 predicted protein [Uncinocarpus reesii 1704]